MLFGPNCYGGSAGYDTFGLLHRATFIIISFWQFGGLLFDIVFGQQGDKGGPLVINDTRCLLAPVLIYENINQLPSVSGVSASDAAALLRVNKQRELYYATAGN